jgi:hypothetical protein
MAHPTATPAPTNSDWYTFLRSAFINGLKAYGASFMMGAPGPLHLRTGDNNTTSSGAPCLPVLETWETSPTGPKPARCPIHRPVSSRDGWETMNPHPDPEFPTPGCPIHGAVSSRDRWETMNSALEWTRA